MHMRLQGENLQAKRELFLNTIKEEPVNFTESAN